MNHHVREVLGFLCRWALLALTAAALPAGFYVATLPGITLTEDRAANFVVPDGLRREPVAMGVYLRGYLRPELGYPSSPVAMTSTPGGETSVSVGSGVIIYPAVIGPSAGVHRVSIRGVPYSPLAFKRAEALLALAGPKQHVFLIDAELFQGLSPADRTAFDALMSELDGRGMVAFFLEGTMDAYLAIKDLLGRSYPTRPLLWHGPAKEGWYLTIGHLGKDVLENSSVITADAALAGAAVKRGIRADLIGAEPLPAPGDAGSLLSPHASIAILKESLATQPIGH